MRSGPLAPLGERTFIACWTAGFLAAAANWMLNLSVPFLVYEMTDSKTWLGIAAIAANAPAVIASPLGGAMADRFSKRVVLLCSLAFQMTFAFTFYQLSANETLSLRLILVLSSCAGFASQINLSAYQSFVAEIVQPRQITAAYRLNAIQFNASRAIGPAIAGIVLDQWGSTTAFMIHGLAYIPLTIVLIFITPRVLERAKPKNILIDLAEGARVSWQDVRMRYALMTVSLSSLFGMSVQPLMAGIAKDVFDVGEQGLGQLVSAIGVSAVVTSIAAVWLAEWMSRSIMVRVGLVFYGLGLWVVAATADYQIGFAGKALTPDFRVGLAGFAITGFAHVLVNVSVTTAIQEYVPESIRGRVTSLQLMGIIVAMPIGAQLGGLIAEAYGLPLVLWLYGAALASYALYGHFKLDRLHALD